MRKTTKALLGLASLVALVWGANELNKRYDLSGQSVREEITNPIAKVRDYSPSGSIRVITYNITSQPYEEPEQVP